jgi:hypothetical protein
VSRLNPGDKTPSLEELGAILLCLPLAVYFWGVSVEGRNYFVEAKSRLDYR